MGNMVRIVIVAVMTSICLTNASVANEIPAFIEEKTHLFYQRVKVEIVDKILRNEAGKVINQ